MKASGSNTVAGRVADSRVVVVMPIFLSTPLGPQEGSKGASGAQPVKDADSGQDRAAWREGEAGGKGDAKWNGAATAAAAGDRARPSPNVGIAEGARPAAGGGPAVRWGREDGGSTRGTPPRKEYGGR